MRSIPQTVAVPCYRSYHSQDGGLSLGDGTEDPPLHPPTSLPCLGYLRGVVGHGLHHGGLARELLRGVRDVGRVRRGSHQGRASGGGGLHHRRG